MFDERLQAAGDRAAGGVVACRGDDRVVRDGLDVVERAPSTVALAIAEARSSVVGPAVLRELLEVGEHVEHRHHVFFVAGAALQFRVVVADEFLGERA